jgi:hypothetical protein
MSLPNNQNAKTQRIHFFEEADGHRLARLEQRMEVVEREAAGIADMKTDVAIIKSKLSTILWFVGSAAGAVIVLVVAKMAKILGI